jgi:hypothetical protein
MKSTLMFRQIANPRRTTLAHLKDVSELGTTEAAGTAGAAEAEAASREAAATARELPQRTANPRRTVLNELPRTPVAP